MEGVCLTEAGVASHRQLDTDLHVRCDVLAVEHFFNASNRFHGRVMISVL